MRKTLTAMLLAGASLTAAQAHAATIVGLVNTGTNNGSGIDANWTVNGGPAYVTTANAYPVGSAWLNNNMGSAWVTPLDDQGASLDPLSNGLYQYSLNFDLTGFHANTASFLGRFLVDNQVSSIVLNGNVIFNGPAGGFTGSDWVNFGANSGFVSGNNVLQVNAVNFAQNSGNPSGLRVEFLESAVAAVPEPSAWALMIAGFAMTGFAMRRRKPQLRTRVSFA